MKQLLIIWGVICVCLLACEPSGIITDHKSLPGDPYQDQLPISYVYDIDATQNAVLEGRQGTVFIVPKGSFLKDDGEIYTGTVSIELAEAYQLEEMLLANLTTTSDGQPLQTGGMIYWNARTANGRQLQVNPDNPITIEVPTENALPSMQVYQSIRDQDGNMDWTDPQPLNRDLITVDMALLNFYPPGYEQAVDRGLPFRGHKTATPELKDSLFYALAVTDPNSLYKEFDLDYIFEGIGGFLTAGVGDEQSPAPYTPVEKFDSTCGINPASIKVIRGKDYQNTFIATREFESRLQDIYRSNQQSILDIYIKGLDRPLWECDDEAATQLTGTTIGQRFRNYAAEKQGKVMDSGIVSTLLKQRYERDLKSELEQLERMKAEALEAARQKSQEADARFQAYSDQLGIARNRSTNRYRFATTRFGWLNIDRPLTDAIQSLIAVDDQVPSSTFPEQTENFDISTEAEEQNRITIKVPSTAEFEQADVFLVPEEINAIGKAEQIDSETFALDWTTWQLPPKVQHDVFFIGRKSTQQYFGYLGFTTDNEILNLEIKAADLQEIRNTIEEKRKTKKAHSVASFNYLNELVANEKEAKDRYQENMFLWNLYHVIKPACGDLTKGQMLFRQNCSRCHSENLCIPSTAPALSGVTEKRERYWLHLWIENSAELIQSGDPLAVQIWKDNNKSAQSAMPHLTTQDIEDILSFIQQNSSECPPQASLQ